MSLKRLELLLSFKDLSVQVVIFQTIFFIYKTFFTEFLKEMVV